MRQLQGKEEAVAVLLELFGIDLNGVEFEPVKIESGQLIWEERLHPEPCQ